MYASDSCTTAQNDISAYLIRNKAWDIATRILSCKKKHVCDKQRDKIKSMRQQLVTHAEIELSRRIASPVITTSLMYLTMREREIESVCVYMRVCV